MIISNYVYVDTRVGFGLFSPPADIKANCYLQWLEGQFSNSAACVNDCSLWGLAQKINELQFLLKNNKTIITVLGSPKEAAIALMFLHDKLPGFTDSIILLTGSLND